MRLTRLRVKNFRSIAEMDIPLSPLTVLVGPNGSGKSNVVDALRFVRDIFTRGLDQAVMDREGMNVIQRWGSEEGIGIEIKFYIDEQSSSGYYETDSGLEFATAVEPATAVEFNFVITEASKGRLSISRQALRIRTEGETKSEFCVIKQGNSVKFKLNKNSWIAREEKSNLSIAHQAFDSIFRPYSFLESGKNVFLESNNPKYASSDKKRWIWESYTYVTKSFEEFIDRSNFYTLNPADLRQPQQILKETPFDEKGRNMAAVLRRLKRIDEGDWENLRHSLQQAVAGFENIEVEPVGGYLATKLTYQSERATPRTSYLGQESDGTIRMLGLLTALYQDPQQPFIAIEEPEANIHPGALAVLAGALDQASLRSQIVLTTHSPDILDQLPVESFLVVEKVGDTTRVGPLEASQVQSVRKKLFTAGELLRMEGLQRQPAPNETA